LHDRLTEDCRFAFLDNGPSALLRPVSNEWPDVGPVLLKRSGVLPWRNWRKGGFHVSNPHLAHAAPASITGRARSSTHLPHGGDCHPSPFRRTIKHMSLQVVRQPFGASKTSYFIARSLQRRAVVWARFARTARRKPVASAESFQRAFAAERRGEFGSRGFNIASR